MKIQVKFYFKKIIGGSSCPIDLSNKSSMEKKMGSENSDDTYNNLRISNSIK